MTEAIKYILAIIFYIFSVVIIVGLMSHALKKKITVRATVTEKHETEFDSISHHNPNGSEHIYVLTFLTDKNIVLQLKTSRWVYGTVEVGDSCTVTYKGSVLYSVTDIESPVSDEPDNSEPDDSETDNQE